MTTKVALPGPFGKQTFYVQIGDQALTPHGGVALLLPYLQELSLADQLHSCLSHLDGTQFAAGEMINLLLVSKCIGDERMRDLLRLSHDEALKALLGLERIPHPTTAGRFLGRMTESDLYALQLIWAETVRERLLADRRTVVVDVDSTPLPQWGEQEGSAKGYCPTRRGARSYHPNLAFDSKTGLPLHQILRPGNRSSIGPQEEFLEFLEFLFRWVLPKIQCVIFRGDSGYFAGYVFDWLEEHGAQYVISARGRQFPGLQPESIEWSLPRKGVQYGEFQYQMKSWDRPLLRCTTKGDPRCGVVGSDFGSRGCPADRSVPPRPWGWERGNGLTQARASRPFVTRFRRTGARV